MEKADTFSPNTKQTQTTLVPNLRVLPIFNLMSLDDHLQTESIHMLNSSMCVPELNSNNEKTTFSQILVISSIGLLLALALHYRLRKIRHSKNIPRLRRSHKHKGHEKLERFSHYVGKINLHIILFEFSMIIYILMHHHKGHVVLCFLFLSICCSASNGIQGQERMSSSLQISQ